MSVLYWIVGIVCLIAVVIFGPRRDDLPVRPRKAVLDREIWKRLREDE